MFNKLAIISVPVKSQQAAKAFYMEKLGCTVVTDVPFGEGETRWIELEIPGTGTAITLVNWFEKMPPGSLQGVVLTTDNMAATHAELKRRGLDISEVKDQPYALEAVFYDPDGNGWVLEALKS
ncbi:MAG TPA: VOC family protein [Phototrophicaceae bacterium]|nr:VOC family protein [Phototrophicaceae bacterium]